MNDRTNPQNDDLLALEPILDAIPDDDCSAFVDKILQKPFYIEELSLVIRELLDKRG
jgi:hypothetical protein